MYVRYADIVTGEELVTSALAIAGDPRFEATRFVVGDWLNYRRTNVRTEDVRKLVAVMRSVCRVCPFVKNATVIRLDDTGNALVAFYKMLVEDISWKVEIFHNCDDAFTWLGANIDQSAFQTC